MLYQPTTDEWAIDDGDGWDRDALEAALEEVIEKNSSSVVILHQGRILAERHAAAGGHRHTEDAASVQKSLVSVLIGIAQDRDMLSVDDPVSRYLGDSWSRAQPAHEKAILIRHLLSMTSGLTVDLATYMAAAGDWSYNTPGYHLTKWVLEAAADLDLDTITSDWLTGPTGMADTTWCTREPIAVPADADGLRAGLESQGFGTDRDGRMSQRMPDGSLATGLATSARDLARLGLLLQADGYWRGRQIVSGEWIRSCTCPSQDLNGAYGLLFWNNRRPGLDASGQPIPQLVPEAPPDLFGARGATQQFVDVCPSLGVTVSRIGGPPGASATQVSVSRLCWSAIVESIRR